MVLLRLIVINFTLVQEVAVFYDKTVEGGRDLAANNPSQLAKMMVKKLKSQKLTAEIVDSDSLTKYYAC